MELDELNTYKQLEINVTQRCNAVCEYCDRLVGVVNLRNTDLTAKQARLGVAAIKEHGYRPTRVSVAGGEPMVNKELEGIIHALAPLKRNVVVLTNCVTEYELPKQTNGKRIWFRHAALEKKEHYPFLVSPADAGMESKRRTCAIQHKCGIAFDAFGFSMCPVATTLAHVLRIDVYKEVPTADRMGEICRHCPHSIRRGPRLALYEKVRTGEIKYPTPTLQAGLEAFQADPITFKRFGEAGNLAPPKKPKKVLPVIQPVGYRAKGVDLPSKFIKADK